MYEDQVLILKYCMQEYGDKFPDVLVKSLFDAGIKIGVKADYKIESECDGNTTKYNPEFKARDIDIDLSSHDGRVRDELIKEFIDRFPEVGVRSER